MITKGLMSSLSNEWYTPEKIVKFIEKKYGKISLDPCASKYTFIGEKNYTKEDNGLSKDWDEDVVFVNPPYGREIKFWVKKAFEENKKYNNTIMLLIPSRTDTSYWHDYIFPNYNEILFFKGRVNFKGEDGSEKPAPFPSCLVIFGGNKKEKIGTIDLKKEI